MIRHRGIDFWMTACQQGQPERVNRGGVETVTTSNNDQSRVVVALMRSRADRKDVIIGFSLTRVISGLSSFSEDQFMDSLGGIKFYGHHAPCLKPEGSDCHKRLHFWPLIYRCPQKPSLKPLLSPQIIPYCRRMISRTEVKQLQLQVGCSVSP